MGVPKKLPIPGSWGEWGAGVHCVQNDQEMGTTSSKLAQLILHVYVSCVVCSRRTGTTSSKLAQLMLHVSCAVGESNTAESVEAPLRPSLLS